MTKYTISQAMKLSQLASIKTKAEAGDSSAQKMWQKIEAQRGVLQEQAKKGKKVRWWELVEGSDLFADHRLPLQVTPYADYKEGMISLPVGNKIQTVPITNKITTSSGVSLGGGRFEIMGDLKTHY